MAWVDAEEPKGQWIDAPSVTPGDVEARAKQVAVQPPAEPDKVRPDVSMLKELGQGITRGVSGVYNTLFNPTSVVPSELSLKGLLESSPIQALLGAAQAGGAVFAPLSNYAARKGEELSANLPPEVANIKAPGGVSEVLGVPLYNPFGGKEANLRLSDILAGARTAVIEAAAPAAVGEAAKLAKPIVATQRFASPRKLASEKGEDLVRQADALKAETTRVKEGVEAFADTMESLGQKQHQAIPTVDQVKAKFAPNAPLGKEAGAGWQAGYRKKLAESRAENQRLYGPVEREAAGIETPAENYFNAGGTVAKPKGVTGVRPTQPESLASRIKSRLEDVQGDFEMDDTYAALKKQLDEAPPGDRKRIQDAIEETIGDTVVPEKPTVQDLIKERRRLGAAKAAVRDDNSKRQFEILINALEEDIAKANAGLAERLFAADKRYATEHAPFFARGSITREISEGRPEAVVDMIYRPTVAGSGRVLRNDAVEAVKRARALIDNPTQWEQVNKSFINKLANQPEGFVKAWDKYTDISNTGNQVLREGLGEVLFKDIQATVNQMKTGATMDVDGWVKEAVKGMEKSGAAFTKGREAAFEITKKRVLKEIEDVVGKPGASNIARRVEGIGAGIMASGGMTLDAPRFIKGLGIMISGDMVAAMMASVKGRSLLKFLARTAPGTAQGAAAARQIDTFLREERQLNE